MAWLKQIARVLCAAVVCGCGLSRGFAAEPTKNIDFNTQVRPIFNQHCIACHGGIKQAAGLSFIRRATVTAKAESGETPVVPGDPDHSFLLKRVTAADDERMPPADHGRALNAEEIAVLRKWIAQGAPWQEHWAYVKPVKPPLPKVSDPAWCRDALDRFVLARLDLEKLHPSAPADRRTWLRRVSFDLIGLPPTAEEIQTFLADESPQAFETVVDRLLASPRFGERWASVWLDLARYADTMGYEKDTGRNIWPYRDWLIRAFNADMPFDEFTIKQLAGDLLDRPTMDDLIATGFHRNTQTNAEGGTDDEEFRVAAVIDRVNTTWQVWQATTFGCTQCHAHPYAPIDHDEYYKFMAAFNNTRDCDLTEEYPLLDVPLDASQWESARAIDQKLSDLRHSQHREFWKLAADQKLWRGLIPDKAVSTGSAELHVQETDGQSEILAQGTLAANSQYTIDFPLSQHLRFEALKIEVLPKDIEAALKTPETGFVLSQLRVYIITPKNEQPREIECQLALCDEAEPFFDPQASLKPDPLGWGAFSKLSQPRSAVFIPKEPIEIEPGERLRLVLVQNKTAADSVPMVIERARFSLSASEQWQKLVSSEEFKNRQQEIVTLQKKRSRIEHVSMPVMCELAADQSRHTYEFERGNWLAKGQEVQAGTPALFPPLPAGAPVNRLTIARWLVSEENPLTARVMVNRLWAQLFGAGIVETAEDFGSSGSPPSHPELLDYLARRFQDDLHWSVKSMLRELVLSATYRQDAKTSMEVRQRDPQNQLLSRGPRNRLTAEMVRDQALAVSGLISDKMYGPPVMPPQPEGVWRSVYNGQKWTAATGADRYRRSIYTYWKRTSGYPSMLSFDAPSRDICTARRIVTNTPLQALTTLNDEAYIECAQALAKRMHAAAGPEIRAELAWAYTEVTGQIAPDDAISTLEKLFNQAQDAYEKNPALSKKLSDRAELAARTVAANAILNLDQALTK
jgi:mono/diheme cytochrome c family protein